VTGAAPERPLPRGTLYLWPDGILFIGSDMVNESHRHFTASILIGLSGDLRLYVGDATSPRTLPGVLVAPNTEQHMSAEGTDVIILQVDPEGSDFARIAHHFTSERRVSELAVDVVERIRTLVAGARRADPLDPAALWEAVIGALCDPTARPRQIDDRVQKVLGILKDSSLEPPTAGQLARQVGLSEGRLIHLFTEQMGLPIRRYTLWLRLRDAFLSLAFGTSITDAAHHAGFSDSAHMSRTFRGMFGIPPSFFKEGRGQVRTEFVRPASLDRLTHPGDAERWQQLRQGPR
jgi:AraC-like DNA-binding protein